MYNKNQICLINVTFFCFLAEKKEVAKGGQTFAIKSYLNVLWLRVNEGKLSTFCY